MRFGNVRLLGIINFLTDFRPYSAVAVLYFARISGSYTEAMSVFSVIMFSSTIFELPTGVISDRIGRKATLIAGGFASTISLVVYALAPGFGVLLLGAVFEGLSRALFSGNNNALLYDSLEAEGRGDRFHDIMGKTGSLFQVALAISAILGSLIADRSFRLAVGIWAIFQAGIVFTGCFLTEPRRSAAEQSFLDQIRIAIRGFRSDRSLRRVTIANGVSDAVGEASFQFQAAFTQTVWPLWAIGIARALSNVGAAISFWLSGRLIDRFGEIRMLLAARIFGRIMTTFALMLRSVVSPLLISSTSLLFGVSVVSGESYIQKRFSDGQRATMGSMSALIGSLFFAAVSPLVGLLADTIGPVGALLIAQAVMLIPIAILVSVRRDGREGPNT